MLVIVIVIYLLYLWLFGDSGQTALSGMRNAEHEHTISGHKLPAGASSDYTYSIWLFISNWNYRIGQEKVIFERQDKGGHPAPRVSLGKNLNNIIVTLATYPHKSGGGDYDSGRYGGERGRHGDGRYGDERGRHGHERGRHGHERGRHGHERGRHREGYENENKPVSHSCVLENVPLQAWANVILTLK